MNVYVDISFIHYLFLVFIIKKEVSNILGIKSKDFIKSLLLSLIFILYFFDLSKYILLAQFLMNLLINKNKKLLVSLLFSIFYLISPITYILFKGTVFYINYLVLLTSFQGLFILFFELIFYKMLSFLANKIIIKFRMKKFIYNVELSIDKKSLKLRGFYDSGNNFCVYKYPVIFLKTKKSLKLGGISSFDNFYKKEFKKGVLKYKQNKTYLYKEVLISEVSDLQDFNGCDCLLNSSIF